MHEDVWRLLYETYVYEELLVGSLAGRYINTNQLDDSSIYSYKLSAEIERRLSISSRKQDLEREIRSSSIRACYKIPDLLPCITHLKSLYPSCEIIVMRRMPSPTIASLLDKGWFANGSEGLQSSRIYPFRVTTCDGVLTNIPYWVSDEDCEWWINAKAEERSLYYYIINTPLNSEQIYVVDYEKLIQSPAEIFDDLSSRLGLVAGARTIEILESISPQRSSCLNRRNYVSKLVLAEILSGLPQKMQFRASQIGLSE